MLCETLFLVDIEKRKVSVSFSAAGGGCESPVLIGVASITSAVSTKHK